MRRSILDEGKRLDGRKTTEIRPIWCETCLLYTSLDTMTGKIEIVQWSLDDDKEGSATRNNEDLSLGTGC